MDLDHAWLIRAWLEEMSESARTSPDTFDAAVARVVGLHQTQVYGEFCSTEKGHVRSSAHIMTLVWLPNPESHKPDVV